MTHAFCGSFDDTEGCTKCGCLTCICEDETEYDVDGVYTAKNLAEEIVAIIAAQSVKTRSFTALSTAILNHLRECELTNQ